MESCSQEVGPDQAFTPLTVFRYLARRYVTNSFYSRSFLYKCTKQAVAFVFAKFLRVGRGVSNPDRKTCGGGKENFLMLINDRQVRKV